MILKFLFKAIAVGSAGSAVYLSNIVEIPENLINNKNKFEKTVLPITISSLEDIKIYENFYGCKFVFVNNWNNKETYNFKEFLNKNKTDPKWIDLIIKGANNQKQKCETQKFVTLAFHNGNFVIHVPKIK